MNNDAQYKHKNNIISIETVDCFGKIRGLWADTKTKRGLKTGMAEKDLIGKTVKQADISGYGVEIVFTDGTMFSYYPSDGGYSTWDIYAFDELNRKLKGGNIYENRQIRNWNQNVPHI